MMYKSKLRPPEAPLVTEDPYFSVWSFTDNLYDHFTRHWTGRKNFLAGIIETDGIRLVFACKAKPDTEKHFQEPLRAKRKSVNTASLTTTYMYNDGGVELQIKLTTPLLSGGYNDFPAGGKTYAKADGLIWTASMADSREEFESRTAPLWLFANETLSRVPFRYRYDTITAQ
jgi:hypothetical protein